MSRYQYVTAVVAAGLLSLGPATTSESEPPPYPSSPGIGGAGAFIPPLHANGVFGAGGPDAAIGGAGAFIPPMHANGVFGAGGPDAAIGGAGAFTPPSAASAAGD
jgi:hypothetical protein